MRKYNNSPTSKLPQGEYPITNIVESRYVYKVDKYIVRLGQKDAHPLTVWMTERQLAQCELQFEKTPKGYSTAERQVYAVFSESGYYAYAKLEKDDSFSPPRQYNLSDLRDDFPQEEDA